jgi:hypothetical protein
VIITFTCPEHGDWHPDLKDHRSRSTCPAPGCKFRGVPRADQFRRPAAGTSAPAAEPEPDNGVRLAGVDAATGPLHPALRAMARLMLSAACARHHLREARPGGHLSGIAAGPTQRGKTLAAAIICTALGLGEVTGIRQAGRETELSLWGRRIQEPGGRYVLVPSHVLALPFVALDELDKATGPLLRAALRLLQGDAKIDAEGQAVDVAPAAYATSNAGLGVLPESYRRRSACLDAAGLPEVSSVLARQILVRVPRLVLGHLAPPAAELPAAVLERMEGALRAGLTAAGWPLCDVRALELAALGRAGLTGDGDLPGAALSTVVDYLELAVTTGEAHPDWMARLDAWAGGKPAQHPGSGSAGEHDSGPAEQAADAYWHQVEAVGMAGTIGHRLARAVEDLRGAGELPGVPAGMLDEAAGIRQMAQRLLRPDLRKVRDVPGLAVMLPTAQRVTGLADQLAGRMRACAADELAAGYAREHEAAIANELHRRHMLAVTEPAAIEARPAARRPAPPSADQTLARYWRSTRPSGQPPPTVIPGTVLPLQPTWTVPASARGTAAQQPPRVPAGPSAAAILAARRAAQPTLPASDTSVADALTALTRTREAAGLPGPTSSEIAQLYLTATAG